MTTTSRSSKRWIGAITFFVASAILISQPWETALADVDTEERFETVFTSAGYSAALGAGIGAALLAFTSDPKEKVHYITTGAAAGFLGGTALGGYLVLVVDSGSRTGLDPRQRAVEVSPRQPVDSGKPALSLRWSIAQF
jgi:hypothetical protein